MFLLLVIVFFVEWGLLWDVIEKFGKLKYKKNFLFFVKVWLNKDIIFVFVIYICLW